MERVNQLGLRGSEGLSIPLVDFVPLWCIPQSSSSVFRVIQAKVPPLAFSTYSSSPGRFEVEDFTKHVRNAGLSPATLRGKDHPNRPLS
jgi:hypothetical protein